MAQHGYLREYDEGWERGNDDRDRGQERSWRDDDRERQWRGSGGEWSYRDRGSPDERHGNFMLGERDRGRGSFARQTEERARSGFRDDDRLYRPTDPDQWDNRSRGSASGYGREHGYGRFQGDYGSSGRGEGGFGGRGDWERSPRNFSSHQDDHYRSWRDRQMSALDRDYQDYCREREQQFHQDFDSWRQKRQHLLSQSQQPSSGSGQPQPRQGAQPGQDSSEEVMELSNPTDLSNEPQSGPSPTADATLGTNNSENSGVGRGRR